MRRTLIMLEGQLSEAFNLIHTVDSSEQWFMTNVDVVKRLQHGRVRVRVKWRIAWEQSVELYHSRDHSRFMR